MSVTFELTPEIEEQLRTAAARRGQDAAAFVRDVVEDKLREEPRVAALEDSPQTESLDKMLAGLIGVIHSQDGRGGSRLSEGTGADMARDLAEKQRQGALVILCDTGPLVALLDADDVHHARSRAVLPSLSVPLVTTWPCLTEVMHFLGKARGWEAQAALWQFVRRGALQVHLSDKEQMRRISELMEQYHDAPMDLADASLVALAETLQLARIFTLDVHFHAYRIEGHRAFKIVP